MTRPTYPVPTTAMFMSNSQKRARRRSASEPGEKRDPCPLSKLVPGAHPSSRFARETSAQVRSTSPGCGGSRRISGVTPQPGAPSASMRSRRTTGCAPPRFQIVESVDAVERPTRRRRRCRRRRCSPAASCRRRTPGFRPIGRSARRTSRIARSGRWRGPKTVKKRRHGDRHPEEVVVGVREQLARALGRRVRGDGMLDGIVLGERHLDVVPVDRRRRAEDEACDAARRHASSRPHRAVDD